MKYTRLIMGMPVSIEIVVSPEKNQGPTLIGAAIERAFDYFARVDERFSTYKEDSEISRINKHRADQHGVSIKLMDTPCWSAEMQEVFGLAENTKRETNGYFDISKRDASVDPSGIVKGWAIRNATKIISDAGFENFFVEAGGDIEARGVNERGEKWRVGIRNPFKPQEIVKIVSLSDKGIATSGTYERGAHIWNPKSGAPVEEIASVTVIGPNALEADRFATAAFAMGEQGIHFIEQKEGLEAYQIGKDGIATMTSGFKKYLVEND